MGEIQRYDHGMRGKYHECVKSSRGEWVKWRDVEQRIRELEGQIRVLLELSEIETEDDGYRYNLASLRLTREDHEALQSVQQGE